MQLLDKKGMLMELDGYAGWNTSANTLGTAIAESVAVYYQGKTDRHRHFMVERYLEDVRQAEGYIDSDLFRPPHGAMSVRRPAL